MELGAAGLQEQPFRTQGRPLIFVAYAAQESAFEYLESTYISDLIDEVRINVTHRDVEENINFTQLSEGEQQLLGAHQWR